MLSEVKTTVAVFGCLAATIGLLCLYHAFTIDQNYLHPAQHTTSISSTDEGGQPIPLPPRPSPFYFQAGSFFLILEGILLLSAAAILFKSTPTSISAEHEASLPAEEEEIGENGKEDGLDEVQPAKPIKKPKMLADHDSSDDVTFRISERRERVATATASLGAIVGATGGILMAAYSMNTPEPWYSMKPAQVALFSGVAAVALNAPSAALAVCVAVWEIGEYLLTCLGICRNADDEALRKMSGVTRHG